MEIILYMKAWERIKTAQNIRFKSQRLNYNWMDKIYDLSESYIVSQKTTLLKITKIRWYALKLVCYIRDVAESTLENDDLLFHLS